MAHTLRPYQHDAVSSVLSCLEQSRSTLVVMATGTGKTTVFSEVIHRIGGIRNVIASKALVLAHRFELLSQAKQRIEGCGLQVGIEQASNRGNAEQVIVGSVQTMTQQHRLNDYRPDSFGLIIVDEAHHGVTKSHRKILDYFKDAKVAGFTATPDRLDRIGLGRLFDSVAYQYDLPQAIRDGWLCRIRAKHVNVASVNLVDVGSAAGDLNVPQLDHVMRRLEALHGTVRPLLDETGDRPTFVFATSREHGKELTELINQYRPNSARYADGETDNQVRSVLLAEHGAGKFQFFVTVQIFTEGVDAPWVSAIALCRPTKSRALFSQMVGRGTRNHPGKPDLLVLDFVGNAGNHKLVSVVDILTGKDQTETTRRAKETVPDGQDCLELIDNAERERVEQDRAEKELAEQVDQERFQALQAVVSYSLTAADLLGQYGLALNSLERIVGNRPTPGQVMTLSRFGIPVPPDLTTGQARALIGKEAARRKFRWSTFKQVRTLSKYGIDGKGMRMREASVEIDRIAKNGWRA